MMDAVNEASTIADDGLSVGSASTASEGYEQEEALVSILVPPSHVQVKIQLPIITEDSRSESAELARLHEENADLCKKNKDLVALLKSENNKHQDEMAQKDNEIAYLKDQKDNEIAYLKARIVDLEKKEKKTNNHLLNLRLANLKGKPVSESKTSSTDATALGGVAFSDALADRGSGSGESGSGGSSPSSAKTSDAQDKMNGCYAPTRKVAEGIVTGDAGFKEIASAVVNNDDPSFTNEDKLRTAGAFAFFGAKRKKGK